MYHFYYLDISFIPTNIKVYLIFKFIINFRIFNWIFIIFY